MSHTRAYLLLLQLTDVITVKVKIVQKRHIPFKDIELITISSEVVERASERMTTAERVSEASITEQANEGAEKQMAH